jgi:hypothetical protein
MVIVVTMTLMVTAVLGLSKFNAFETEKQLRQTQARWIAEAGFEKTAAMIKASESFRTSISVGSGFDDVTGELDEDFEDDPSRGHYEVRACQESGPGPEETTFYIESIGEINSAAFGVISSTVRSVLIGAPGVDYALMALGGESEVKGSSSGGIIGDIYVAGKGAIDKTIVGNVEDVNDISTVDYAGGTTYPVDPLPFPHLDQTAYDALLSTANTDINAYQGTNSGPFNLAGAANNTIYVHGDVNIEANVTGSGTIVASGKVTFNKNGKTLAGGVKIVAGGIIDIDKNNTTFGANTELFSKNDILIKGTVNWPSYGMSIMAMNNVTVSANMVGFKGIIYSEGKVTLENGVQSIRGTIIAWNGFDIKSNSTITYDPSVFPDDNPIPFSTWVLTNRRQWEESPF